MKNIDKLIELAKTKDSIAEEITTDLSEARKFAIALELKEGKKKVPARCIYNAYKEWALKPLTKMEFMAQWVKLFMPYRKASYRYYLLNLPAFEIDSKVRKMKGYGKD